MKWVIELILQAAEAIARAVEKRKKKFRDVDDEIDRKRRKR